jgi:hypothetical protein
MSWQAANIAQRLLPCREAAANPGVLRQGSVLGVAGMTSEVGPGRAAWLDATAELDKASRGTEELHPGVGWRHG